MHDGDINILDESIVGSCMFIYVSLSFPVCNRLSAYYWYIMFGGSTNLRAATSFSAIARSAVKLFNE